VKLPDLVDPPHVSWRVFLKMLFAMVATYTIGIEPGRIVVRRVDVLITDLPQPLDGLKIGQLSDLHRNPFMPRARVERAARLMAAEQPDLVALTGDYVSYWPDYAAEYVETLAPLQPRLGMFACTGNHEHWTDPDGIAESLRAAGVTVLRNQHQLVDVGGAQMCVVGVDDIGRTYSSSLHHADPADDLPAALAGSPVSDVFRLLLVHNPDLVLKPVFATEVARRPIHLVLAGHTHGGQVRLPLIGAPHNRTRYGWLFGDWLSQMEGTHVYVSRGAGSSWPLRFNCPPEVNVLTLRAA
jgi:predicted MPP superfamily phosphohydrolase